jgi:farnesyl diphosphate synthase
MKTASLFAFAAEAGAIVAGANGEDCFKMREYGLHLGHAFQIIDDILDVEGEEELVGKKLRKDSAIGKATYLNLMSVAEAYKYAQMHIEQAKDASANKVRLHELAEFILIRKK